MTTEQFLAALEAKSLLPANLMTRLRAQVAKSSKPISAKAVAKSLIDKGHLSAFQAKQLLAEPASQPAAAPARRSATPARSSAPAAHPGKKLPDDLEDMLVPLDDEPGAQLTPLGDDVADNSELVPLEDNAQLVPLEDNAGLMPLDDDLGLTPLDDDPVKAPTKQPAARAKSDKSAGANKSGAKKSAAKSEPHTSLLEDELGLSSPAGPLDGLLGAEGLGDDPLAAGAGNPLLPAGKKGGMFSGGGGAATKKKKAKKKQDEPQVKKSEWDSPIMLAGGGALVLLILIGASLMYLTSVGTGDNQLSQAEEDYKNGSYANAITKYDAFAAAYPTHQNISSVHVHRGMAKLKQALQTSSDMTRGIAVATEVLKELEDEHDFDQVRIELATILPDIAEGAAKQAQTEPDLNLKKTRLADVEKALALVNNQNYVPKRYRSTERMNKIQGIITQVERELSSGAELDKTLAAMKAASDAGESAKAYADRKALLKEYPNLFDNKQLTEALKTVSQDEQKAIKTAADAKPADTKEAASPVVVSLTPANRTGAATFDAEARVAVVATEGATYGLNSSNGAVQWRRPIGFQIEQPPVNVSADPQSDVLLADSSRNELARVKAKTGKLVWRQELGEPFLTPLVADGKLTVTTKSGHVVAMDLNSGDITSRAILPQPVKLAPAASINGAYVYQLGEHSSLYVLGAGKLDCKEVFYLGHEPEAVAVPPVVAARHVIVAENTGAESAKLRVLSADMDGLNLAATQEVELAGHVLTPPVILGRMLIVLTDRGQIIVYALGFANDEKPLTQVADSPATGPMQAIPLALGEASNLWIARSQLAKYEVQAVGGRMVARSLAETFEGSAFDDRLQKAGNVLLAVRRRPGVAGVTVTAIDLEGGKRVWETTLAVPPAGAPLADVVRKQIDLVTADGALYSFDSAAIKARVVSQATIVARPDKQTPLLRTGTPLAGGAAVFSAGSDDKFVLTYKPGDKPLAWLTLPDAIACAPGRFGKGFVAATKGGQLLWIDPANGNPLSTPFQPTLQAGSAPAWRAIGTAGDNANELVVSDGQAAVYRIGVKTEPTPHLAALADNHEMAAPIVSPVAAVGQFAYAVDSEEHVVKLALPGLTVGETESLGGQPLFGPERVGEHVLVESDQGELLAFDGAGKLAWRQKLQHGELSGRPLEAGSDFILTSKSGSVWKASAASGEQSKAAEIGQPLATGPAAFGERLVVAGHDGTIFVIERP